MAALCAFPDYRRDRPCDSVTRRRVIVDRRPVAEKLDDDEAGPDDRQRTAGRDASQAPETAECRGTVLSRWRGPRYSAAPPGERPVLKLMYAALIRATTQWRGIKVTAFERKQGEVVREQLDAANGRHHARPVTRPRGKKGQEVGG